MKTAVKMDVDQVDEKCIGRHRPFEKSSLVNVDQVENSSLVDVDQVENSSSLVDVNQENSRMVDVDPLIRVVWSTSTEKTAGWSTVDVDHCIFLGRLQPTVFIMSLISLF